MPTYEYRCKACEHTFERIQKITAQPVATCPDCGGEAERIISGGAGLLFKGSGFYITDYRSDSYKKAAENEKGGAGAKKDDKKAPASGEKKETSKSEKSSKPKDD